VHSYQVYSKTATKRYKGGLESFLSVLDADRQLFTAELDLAAVQQNQLLTLVQLYKALGGGRETEKKAPELVQSVPTPFLKACRRGGLRISGFMISGTLLTPT
jgi:hypothetical protein